MNPSLDSSLRYTRLRRGSLLLALAALLSACGPTPAPPRMGPDTDSDESVLAGTPSAARCPTLAGTFRTAVLLVNTTEAELSCSAGSVRALMDDTSSGV